MSKIYFHNVESVHSLKLWKLLNSDLKQKLQESYLSKKQRPFLEGDLDELLG